MRQILITFFFLITLFVPQNETLAQATRTVPECTTEIVDPVPVGRTDRNPPVCANPEAVCFRKGGIGADCYRLTDIACKKLLSCNTGDSLTSGTQTCTPAGGGADYPATISLDTANICPTGLRATSNDLGTCKCGTDAGGAAAAATVPAATPCTNPRTCTISRGLRCDPGSGAAGGGDGIMTAIGCIPTKPQALVEALLKYGTFAAGATAFLLMILGALQMITAEGNPDSIKRAQEKFYSAIIGLLLIIFSVLLMQVIGVDILNLPGFARN